MWMTSCPEEMVLRIWGFWKDSVEIGPLRQELGIRPLRVEFWPFKDVVGLFGSLPIEILNITRYAAHWGWGQQSKNCVSLLVSPWTEVKKLINRSYLKQQSPPVFACVLYQYCYHWHHQKLYNIMSVSGAQRLAMSFAKRKKKEDIDWFGTWVIHSTLDD